MMEATATTQDQPRPDRLSFHEKVERIESALVGRWQVGDRSCLTDEIIERTGLSKSQISEIGRTRYVAENLVTFDGGEGVRLRAFYRRGVWVISQVSRKRGKR
jgi:hypothetical protein